MSQSIPKDEEVKKEEPTAKSSSGGNEDVRIKVVAKPYISGGVKNVVYVAVDIITSTSKETLERAPFNLAISLDRSGSMSGDAFDNSKSAINKIISSLNKKDTVHLVVYDDNVDTVFTNGNLEMKQNLIQQVNKLETGGSTNLFGGLEAAIKLLIKSEKKGGRVFLFSDGLANAGVTDKNEIYKNVTRYHKENGVNVSCFGIGNSYDEVLMKGIAEAAGGGYFFIDGSKDVENKIKMGMNLLTALFGKDALLKVKGVNGACVTKVFAHTDQELVSGVKIGDVIENDVTKVLIELEVKPSTDDEKKGPIKYLDLSFEYDDTRSKTKKRAKGELSMEATSDDKKVNVVIDDIEIALELARSYERDAKCLKLVSEGKVEEAIKEKERDVISLKKIESIDKSGMLTPMIKRGEENLKNMKEKKDREQMQRDIGYSHKQKYYNKRSHY